ncbi:hypothetical protein CXG81DRAFT_18127 [Caulochytrium protostelioides]|uniref:Uncharacterized protein n=1 Tax=Caulochytrium protostelioides TaxID=1555241 RepID=A0A4P9X9X0_9FUNG|nr:hypothetical protein CXG81DRAFT_18127 [Caulochytrium protostelioides]|eukprot:RKP02154.1 hypothetical protein CXG81DRAFT_18127 [Caulochytrium protostelioides]
MHLAFWAALLGLTAQQATAVPTNDRGASPDSKVSTFVQHMNDVNMNFEFMSPATVEFVAKDDSKDPGTKMSSFDLFIELTKKARKMDDIPKVDPLPLDEFAYCKEITNETDKCLNPARYSVVVHGESATKHRLCWCERGPSPWMVAMRLAQLPEIIREHLTHLYLLPSGGSNHRKHDDDQVTFFSHAGAQFTYTYAMLAAERYAMVNKFDFGPLTEAQNRDLTVFKHFSNNAGAREPERLFGHLAAVYLADSVSLKHDRISGPTQIDMEEDIPAQLKYIKEKLPSVLHPPRDLVPMVGVRREALTSMTSTTIASLPTTITVLIQPSVRIRSNHATVTDVASIGAWSESMASSTSYSATATPSTDSVSSASVDSSSASSSTTSSYSASSSPTPTGTAAAQAPLFVLLDPMCKGKTVRIELSESFCDRFTIVGQAGWTPSLGNDYKFTSFDSVESLMAVRKRSCGSLRMTFEVPDAPLIFLEATGGTDADVTNQFFMKVRPIPAEFCPDVAQPLLR